METISRKGGPIYGVRCGKKCIYGHGMCNSHNLRLLEILNVLQFGGRSCDLLGFLGVTP